MSDQFNRHDNIDRDVIEVSKSSLLILLDNCRKYGSAPAEFFGYAGIALALLTSAFLTESFHDLWFVPGETIRAAFMIGGLVALGRAGFQGWRWFVHDGSHTPEAIVSSLAQAKEAMLALPPGQPSTSTASRSKTRVRTRSRIVK